MNVTDRIEKITSVYKTLPKAWAIALFGSRARGTATEKSDINIMVVQSEMASQSARAQILSILADPDKPSICREQPIPADYFYSDNVPISIWHIPEDVICERVSDVVRNKPLKYPLIVSILHTSKILWDPKMQLEAWKNVISPIPLEYKQTVIPVLFSGVTNGLEIMDRHSDVSSTFFSHHEQGEVIKVLYEIIFLANDSYIIFSPHLDREINKLKNIPEGFLKHIQAILSLGSDPEGLQARWRRLCHLVQIVGNFLEELGLYNLKSGWTQLRKTAPFLFDFED
ncbi:MAG: nucleotidyltransferase domain-containing protein [bacterium]